jgi:hypothetical protein
MNSDSLRSARCRFSLGPKSGLKRVEAALLPGIAGCSFRRTRTNVVRRACVQHARSPIQPPSIGGLSAHSEHLFEHMGRSMAILTDPRSKNASVAVAARAWARPLDADIRARRRGRATESPRRASRAVRRPSRSSSLRRVSPTRTCSYRHVFEAALTKFVAFACVCSINGKTYAPINLDRIAHWVEQGRLTSSPEKPITARELVSSGCIHNAHDGVKLLGDVRHLLALLLLAFLMRYSLLPGCRIPQSTITHNAFSCVQIRHQCRREDRRHGIL